jgi:hypothetical protein
MRQHLLLHTYNPSDKSLSGAHNEYRIIVTLARTDHRKIVYSIVAVKTNKYLLFFKNICTKPIKKKIPPDL